MAQASLEPGSSSHPQGNQDGHGKTMLGPLLCWAVVFADIGSSIYYTPGILYGSVGKLAGFFVILTMTVFVLLTLKYAEVSARFPEGGGVVSVAAQAIHPWMGALGGMFILVSYFLTAAISCLSAFKYLSVVIPQLAPIALWVTIGVLALLGLLNWVGVSESAKVSLIGALIAFGSDIAILWTVFSHISPPEFFLLFSRMFEQETLTPTSILVGFAGAFLAFSGLESISQLSPVMKSPRKKIISLALLLVVLTVGLTSPLLTMLATLLQPRAAADELLSTQLISLLGGHWGDTFLQTGVAVSASLILMFASNTAIIGAYHVFLALSKMQFLPAFILKRNRLRNTPHWSIGLATGIPIAVLLLAQGQIDLLGDMYAFGLLGAFTLTCIGLDIIRYRERRAAYAALVGPVSLPEIAPASNEAPAATVVQQNGFSSLNGQSSPGATHSGAVARPRVLMQRILALWHQLDFWLGLLTTACVLLAWVISLISRPLATAFGGSVALAGIAVAYINSTRGRLPVVMSYIEGRLRDSVLVVLTPDNQKNDLLIHAAIDEGRDRTVIFLYLGKQQKKRTPRPFEIVDPYLEDQQAKSTLAKAGRLAHRAGVNSRFLYRQEVPGMVAALWQWVQAGDVVLTPAQVMRLKEINPDRIRYVITPQGKVAHLLKRW
jgi:amino acid transporter